MNVWMFGAASRMSWKLGHFMPFRAGSRLYWTQPSLCLGARLMLTSRPPRQSLLKRGACLALGRYSAAVFHLVRTLEVGLTVLAASLNVTVKNPNWENVLNDIASAVNKITPATHGASWKEYQKYCSEVAASFRVFKNAWRNYAMHLHERYDQERALAIWDGVKVFMNDLAKRLKE
jgi:hypothetical protein